MGRKESKKFYAVSNGLQIGIYTSFNRANQQTNGVSGSCYKGYATLDEAKKHMHAAGISAPMLFNHDNVRVCSSDTELDIDVYCNDTLPSPQDVGNPVMILESSSSNGMNLNSLSSTPNRSLSCTLCSTDSEISLRFPTAPLERVENIKEPKVNTIIKDISSAHCSNTNNQGYSVEKSDSITQIKQDLSHVVTSDNVSSNSYIQDALDSKKTNNILVNLVSQVSMLNEQIKTQHNCIATFTLTTQKLLAEQCHLANQLNEQQKNYASLAETVNQHLVKHDRESETQNTLSDDDVKIADHLIAAQESLAAKATDMQKQLETLQKDMTLCLNVLTKDSQPVTALTPSVPIQALNMNPLPSTSITSTHVSQTPNKSCSSETQRKITGRQSYSVEIIDDKESVPDDENLVEVDDNILKYHSFLQMKEPEVLKDRANNPIKIPSSCDKLIFGDSTLKHVNKKRIDHTGSTEIRTFHGSNLQQLSHVLKSTEKLYPQVSKVCICAGSVDCHGSQISNPDQIKADFSTLVTETNRIFPNACISVAAIPPQKSPKANVLINKLNKSIQFFFRKSPVRFLDNNDLWSCVDGDGKVEVGILLANAYLSERGLSLFLRQVLGFIGRPRTKYHGKPEEQKETKPVTYPINGKSASPQTSSDNGQTQQIPFTFPFGRCPLPRSPPYPYLPYPGIPMNPHHFPFSFSHCNFPSYMNASSRAPGPKQNTAVWV